MYHITVLSDIMTTSTLTLGHLNWTIYILLTQHPHKMPETNAPPLIQTVNASASVGQISEADL